MIAVASIVGIFVYSLPFQYESFRSSSRYAGGYAESLAQIGLSASSYAAYFAILNSLQVLIVVAVALVIFTRKRDDWLALHLSAAMVFNNITTIPALHEVLGNSAEWLFIFSTSGVILALFIFPDGRFVPTSQRWLIVVIMAIPLWASVAYVSLAPQQITEHIQTITNVQTLLQVVGISSQIWRYRRISNITQRQQTKWVILGFATAIFFGSLYIFLPTFVPTLTTPSFDTAISSYNVASLLWQMLGVALVILGLSAIPLSITLSMMRYRLWDIDLTINRSLVLVGVTSVLLALFVGVFSVLQALLRGLFTTGDELAIALAGVTVGMAFNPTRQWVRRIIDRKLYGFRFDLNQARRGQRINSPTMTGMLSHQQVGGWHLQALLGRGGMGEVYRGVLDDGRIAAVKIMNTDLSAKADLRERFLREGQLAPQLRHPHIVRTLEAGYDEPYYYIVLEFIEGVTLREHLQKHGRYSLEEAYGILYPIASALDFLHQQGLVHRDLKPANIMLEGTKPILMDFGIAKIIGGDSLTGSGAVGTIEYIAPEQILDSRKIDHRADIYALGVLSYELLTGQTPFTGNAGQIVFNHLYQPPPAPQTLAPDLPLSACESLLSALAKDPAQRPTSASLFVTTLCGATL